VFGFKHGGTCACGQNGQQEQAENRGPDHETLPFHPWHLHVTRMILSQAVEILASGELAHLFTTS
jgi:hypothetical protein